MCLLTNSLGNTIEEFREVYAVCQVRSGKQMSGCGRVFYQNTRAGDHPASHEPCRDLDPAPVQQLNTPRRFVLVVLDGGLDGQVIDHAEAILEQASFASCARLENLAYQLLLL
ncbi:hypothetical protein HYQ44_006551 [Verticillium longisporum]|nr:hypothetical protein HYQ44_006551 [Verticillium longisporum]